MGISKIIQTCKWLVHSFGVRFTFDRHFEKARRFIFKVAAQVRIAYTTTVIKLKSRKKEITY